MLTIRTLTASDIPAGMALKEQAGWNQTPADWRRLIDLQPDGCFLAELDDRPVGTVTTCRFGPVAYIAMMLVDDAFRGRGIGRALMTRALESLDGAGVLSARLDATPMGRPLYESLGFLPESVFDRFQGELPPAGGTETIAHVCAAEGVDSLLALDREVTGADRGRLLRALMDDDPGALRVVGDDRAVEGFLMSRPGSRALQIGPCLASRQAGPALLADAARRHAGERVVIDVPASHEPARLAAASLGLSAGRQLVRMGRGPRVLEDLARLWASAGPEKG